MKNLILLSFIGIAMCSMAQAPVTIMNTSYTSTTAVAPGSAQWAELEADTLVGPLYDSVRLCIGIDSATHFTHPHILYSMSIAAYYTLPVDTFTSGGSSPHKYPVRRLTFTIPADFPDGVFALDQSLCFCNSERFGLVQTPNGISEPTLSHGEVSAYRYYDMSGRELLDPRGLCIREAVYRDGTLSRGKVFKQ